MPKVRHEYTFCLNFRAKVQKKNDTRSRKPKEFVYIYINKGVGLRICTMQRVEAADDCPTSSWLKCYEFMVEMLRVYGRNATSVSVFFYECAVTGSRVRSRKTKDTPLPTDGRQKCILGMCVAYVRLFTSRALSCRR